MGDITGMELGENQTLKEAKRLFCEYRKALNGTLIKKMMVGSIRSKLETILNETIETPPNSSNYNHECALLIKGSLSLLENRYDDAINLLSGLNSFPALKLLGIAYYRNGDLDKAIDSLEQALQLSPDAETYNILGGVKQRNRDVDGAIEAHKKAYDIDNSNKEANTELARLYREKAATLETEVLNECNVDTAVLPEFKSARTAYSTKNYEVARSLFHNVVSALASSNEDNKLVKAKALHYLACLSTESRDQIGHLRQSIDAKATKEAYKDIVKVHEISLTTSKENAKTD